MKNTRIQLAAIFALLSLAMAPAPRKAAPRAKAAAKSPAVIALIAGRRVDEADIRRAALVMERDPARAKDHAAWRKKLLDFCVDRELLALEAERAGFLKDPLVRRRIEVESASTLYLAIKDKVLVPQVAPTAAQLDTARAGGLFRRVKLGYILSVTDKESTYKLIETLKHGARFDSVAALYSIHPSAPKGGDIGWKYVGELHQASWSQFKTAKPGDVMGPFSNAAPAHEVYLVESIVDPDDKEIRDVMIRDRLLNVESRYYVDVLQKYHFRMNADQVGSMIFASATEPADSILASLDAGGHRPKRDIHPALGVLATVDGDSITYRDLAVPDLMQRGPDGKAHIDDTRDLIRFCSLAALPRLMARDARERGIDTDPAVARRLRLIKEEESTRAMVAKAVPAPDSAAAVAYFHAHPESFQRPAAHRALVAVFAREDTANAALAVWNRKAARDSIFNVEGFARNDKAVANTIFPRFYGEMSLLDTDQDPLSVAVRGLQEGQIAPLIETLNGYAVAEGRGSEPARAYRFEEVRLLAQTQAREEAENAWVTKQLERLRAATPARTVPARLDAVRLGLATETGGNRR